MPKVIDENDFKLGAALRIKRKSAGLSLQNLALELGVSAQQLSKYEKGQNRVTVNMLKKIEETLENFRKKHEGMYSFNDSLGNYSSLKDSAADLTVDQQLSIELKNLNDDQKKLLLKLLRSFIG